MRNPALQERRNRQILADLVRTYIETGEPVSSRAISKRFEESLSTATIRNIMADLEDGGYLYQPHTSAGRVPTAAAYRFFAQEIASQATLTVEDRTWINREMSGANSAAEITERAGHILAEVSRGVGIIVSPPLRRAVLEHALQRGIVVEAYSPLGTGRHISNQTVQRIAASIDRTPAQVLLRWSMQHDLVVIPKSTHRDRIEENAQIFDFTLADQDMAALDAVDRTDGTDRALERPWW